MKKISISIISIVLSFFMIGALANNKPSLYNQRIDTIMRYVTLLGEGDYDNIIPLFTEDAVVVSSSGIADNPTHFYKTLFTQTITSPSSEMTDIMPGKLDKKRMAGLFTFSWTNIKGEKTSAKFLDLFIFETNTAKIKSMFVYGNTFKDDIMKEENQ